MRADPELSRLIADVIDAGLLKPASREIGIARQVAMNGQRSLSAEDRLVWESRILPILAKPIETQMAVKALQRRSNRFAGRIPA